MNVLPAGLPDDFLARLVTGCPDAVIYADAQGRIRFWNEAATRVFGYREAEALGQSLDLIIPERLRDRHWQGYEHVMNDGSRYGAGDVLAVPARHKDERQISGRSRSNSRSCRSMTMRARSSELPRSCAT